MGNTIFWWMYWCFADVCMVIFRIYKKENNKTQKIDNELKLILDKMSARDIYIHKISQNNLIWDKATQTYIKKME